MVEIKKLPVASIVISGNNPRQNFLEEGLRSLGESMLSHGQIDPIIVRPKGNYYELIAGERRWRAAQLVGMKELDAKIQEMDDASCAELRLIENTQREDLTYAEKGDAVYALMEKYPEKYPTIVAVAKALNTSPDQIRTYWCPSSRRLSPNLKKLTASGAFSERLAIYLLKYDHPTQDKLAKIIMNYQLSGHENADIVKFLRLYDTTPNANLEELAQEAKGTKFVRIDTSQLTPGAKKEIENILDERKKEINKQRKLAQIKGNSIPRNRSFPKRTPAIKATQPSLTSQSPVCEVSSSILSSHSPSLHPPTAPYMVPETIKSVAVALSYPIPIFSKLTKFRAQSKMLMDEAIVYLTEKGLEVEGIE